MNKQQHKHRAKTHSIAGWSFCVVGGDHYCDGAAHGGVSFRDECACGAIKFTESNGRHRQTTGWLLDKDAD